MKYLMTLMVGVCLLIASVSALADQTADEAAIRETMKKSFDGINTHDIKAHLSTLTEDYENWTGSMKGLKAREKYLTEIWKWQKSAQHNVVEEIGIILIAPDTAIYKARCESTGEVKKDGTPIPKNEWLGAWILAKKGEKWLIAGFFPRAIEE